MELSKNRNETGLEFLERLKLHKSTVEVKIQTDANLTAEQKALLIRQNELNALDVLAANSDNTLRLLLDIRQPATISEATSVVMRHQHNEHRIKTLTQNQTHPVQKPNQTQNTKFPSNKPSHNYIHTHAPPHPTYAAPTPQFKTYMPPPQPYYNFNQTPTFYRSPTQQKPQFPSQPVPIQTRPVHQRFPTNQQVYGKPKAPSNVFAPKNSHKPIAPPEPMDTSSGNRTIRSNFFKRTGPPNFTFEELHNNELPVETPSAGNHEHSSHYESPLTEEYAHQYTFTETEPTCDYYVEESDESQNFQEVFVENPTG